MKLKLLTLVLSFALLLPASAQAYMPTRAHGHGTYSQATGPYLDMGFSVSMNNDADLKSFKDSGAGAVDASIDFDDTIMFDGALGYDFGDFRVDGSFGYQTQDIKTTTLNTTDYEGRGDMSLLALMVNVYYDFPVRTQLRPYVGAGFGFGQLNMDIPSSAASFSSKDDPIVPVYQATVGTIYQLNPQLGFTLAYRYLKTGEGEFSGVSSALSANEKVKMAFGAHQIRFGMRFGF